jgi:hypothetical protein
MLMKTLFASILGLTAIASITLAEEPRHRDAVQPMQLSPAQMDQVTAGEARSAIEVSGSIAVGPNEARMNASGLATGPTSASVTITFEVSETSSPGRLETVQSTSSYAAAR